MKDNHQTVVLGIDTGARQIGVAVLLSGDLVFYGVKSIKRPDRDSSLVKLRDVLEKLIETYKINTVTLEKVVFVQQHRSFVKIVYDEIRNFLKKRNIRFFEYNPKLVREIVCGHQQPSKRRAALLLVQRYPELARYFNVPRLWQKRYYAQLFDAIAVGLVCDGEPGEIELSPAKPVKNKDV
jgi:Holliday junction resolvasome RuvABC endonuclease subunit